MIAIVASESRYRMSTCWYRPYKGKVDMSANVELLLTVSVSVPFSLLLDKGKTILYPEMQTQLAMMKKKPPLEKSRPDSAISAKMYLSVHRLTLQVRARDPQQKMSVCKSKLTCPQGWRT